MVVTWWIVWFLCCVMSAQSIGCVIKNVGLYNVLRDYRVVIQSVNQINTNNFKLVLLYGLVRDYNYICVIFA